MSIQRNQLSLSVLFIITALFILMGLALASTTWAAPPSQGTGPGTVPPPGGTPTKTPPPPPGKTPTPPGHHEPCVNTPISITTNSVWNLPPASIQDAFISGCTKVISITQGTVPSGTQVSVTPVGQPPCPETPDGMLFLDHCFQVDWHGAPFNGKVLDCLPYSAEDLQQAGGNPNNLLIGFYIDGKWVFVKPSTVTDGYVCAEMDRPFTFQALFTVKPKIPTTGEALPPTPWELWAVIAGIALVLLGSARYAVRRI